MQEQIDMHMCVCRGLMSMLAVFHFLYSMRVSDMHMCVCRGLMSMLSVFHFLYSARVSY